MPVLPSLYIKITRQIIKWNSDHIKTPEMCSKERPIMDFISKKSHAPTHSLIRIRTHRHAVKEKREARTKWHTVSMWCVVIHLSNVS